MKTRIWLVGALALVITTGCVERYKGNRIESGRIIGVVTEEAQIPQDDGSMLPGESVEIGKRVQVGDTIFDVPYKSSGSFASTLKIGDCVRVLVHVYDNPVFNFSNKERFIPDKSREIAPCGQLVNLRPR